MLKAGASRGEGSEAERAISLVPVPWKFWFGFFCELGQEVEADGGPSLSPVAGLSLRSGSDLPLLHSPLGTPSCCISASLGHYEFGQALAYHTQVRWVQALGAVMSKVILSLPSESTQSWRGGEIVIEATLSTAIRRQDQGLA